MNKLFTLAKGLSEGWKIFFGIIGMITIIATTAVKIDHIKNKKVNYEVRIDNWIKYDSLEHASSTEFKSELINSIKGLGDSIRTINKSMRKFSKSQVNLKNYMMDKAATKDDLREIIDIWDNEKKNSETSFSSIHPYYKE